MVQAVRVTACSCKNCVEPFACDGFVRYDVLEQAKAKRLYLLDPVAGAQGDWVRPYKLCGQCSWFCKRP